MDRIYLFKPLYRHRKEQLKSLVAMDMRNFKNGGCELEWSNILSNLHNHWEAPCLLISLPVFPELDATRGPQRTTQQQKQIAGSFGFGVLDEELSGVIEVVGKITPKATIQAAYYAPFREDKNSF
eukprot:g40236.t1